MHKSKSLKDYGMTGETLAGEEIIDAHMHIDQYFNFHIPRFELSNLKANARRLGIRIAYGSSLYAIGNNDKQGNLNAINIYLEYPDFFRPYLVYKPNYPENLDFLCNLAAKHNISHFKLHDDGNNLPYDHRNYNSFYDYANDKRSILLFHTYGQKHLASIAKILDPFKSMTILLAHSGIVDEDQYVEMVKKYDNVFLETSCSLAWYGLIERLVEKTGADRIIFGSDMPFMSPDQQIGRILFARISDNDKRKILGLNARDLFIL